MFERFTDRARRVLVLSQDEARALDHNFLGTEHILLGLLREEEGVAAKALGNLGVDLEQLRGRVEAAIGRGPTGEPGGAPPFTPRAKHALEQSLKEALQLGHNYIGTEHLLLGLLREGEGVACQVLTASGLGLSDVRREVIQLLSGFSMPYTGEPGARAAPRVTMAADRLARLARARAGSEPVGSHHYLLALFDDPQSLAALVLTSVGLTVEAVADRVAAMGTVGTSDETRPVGLGRLGLYELGLGRGVTLKVTDPNLADALRATVGSMGEAGQPGDLGAVIRKALADYLSGSGRGDEPGDEPPAGEPAPGPPAP